MYLFRKLFSVFGNFHGASVNVNFGIEIENCMIPTVGVLQDERLSLRSNPVRSGEVEGHPAECKPSSICSHTVSLFVFRQGDS